jgi:hypothetical protein
VTLVRANQSSVKLKNETNKSGFESICSPTSTC